MEETSPLNPETYDPVPEVVPEPKKSRTGLVLGIVGLFLAVLAALVFLNYTTLKDYFTGLSYEPSSEMIDIKEKLNLTPSADLIFKASFPVLETEEDFNRDCNSHDSEISVLGCFTGDKIYIYSIKASELSGILESTTAHELLHAVWSRLSGSEKAKLTPVLERMYKENEDMLKETLASYADEDRLDELYVRVGTQLKNLPSELSEHYSKYFNNQTSIVDFYEAYIAPFNELKEKIDALGKELGTLKTAIDAETAEYETEFKTFNAAVEKFNSCASTENCFSSESAFYARRRELVADEKRLDEMFEELSDKIKEYNSKIEEYNSNILKSNSLQNIINSNSAPAELTEE